MEHEDIRELAIEAIRGFAQAALSDPAAFKGGANGAGRIADVADRLRARLDPRPTVNPSYAPAHEAAAALLALAATDRATYDAFLSRVAEAYGNGIEPDSYQGLLLMDGFLSAIGDDHDWVADLSGASPVIRYQVEVPHFLPSLTPASLRDVLVPLLDGPAPTPAR